MLLVFLGLAIPAFAEIGEIQVTVEGHARKPAAPPDGSTLWLQTGDRVTSLLIDAAGRRTGVEPKTFKVLQEIPGSECDVDFTANPYTGDEHGKARERLTLIPARKGSYQLVLQGLEAGPFSIAVNSLSRVGSSLPSKSLEGVISEGEEKTLKLTFDPAPNSEVSLIEVSAH